MMREPEKEDTGSLVDSKIDSLLEKLAALGSQVDRASETLIQRNAAIVRRAFKGKEEEAQDG